MNLRNHGMPYTRGDRWYSNSSRFKRQYFELLSSMLHAFCNEALSGGVVRLKKEDR